MIKRRGTLFVVSAPSGAGKTTLCREIRLRLHDIAYSVSVTTRPPRPGEIDGTDFRFVREPAVPRDARPRRVRRVGDRARQPLRHAGASRWRARWPTATTSCSTSTPRARAQLRAALPGGGAGLHRGALDGRARAAAARAQQSTAPSEISRRLARARDEIALWRQYDYLIINRDVKEAMDQLDDHHPGRALSRRAAWPSTSPTWRYQTDGVPSLGEVT